VPIFIELNENEEKISTTFNSYSSKRYESQENGVAIKLLAKPTMLVKKPTNIVAGINGKISMFTGKETEDNSPILYKRNGKIKIWVEMTAAADSRIPNLLGIIFK